MDINKKMICPKCKEVFTNTSFICCFDGQQLVALDSTTPIHSSTLDIPEQQDPMVFRPKHYTKYKIEPFTFIMANKIDFAEGNIIKYICRWRDKNGIQDLKKARRIIDMMIELEENPGDYIPKKGCL